MLRYLGKSREYTQEVKQDGREVWVYIRDIAVTKLPRVTARGGIVRGIDIKERYPLRVNNKHIEVDIYVEGRMNGKEEGCRRG